MDPHIPGSDFVVYLVTNPISRKVSEISKNRNATLLFQNQNGYVSIEGEISLVPEPNIKDDYWKKEWTPFYNDRNKALILKVNPKEKPTIAFLFKIIISARFLLL